MCGCSRKIRTACWDACAAAPPCPSPSQTVTITESSVATNAKASPHTTSSPIGRHSPLHRCGGAGMPCGVKTATSTLPRPGRE